MSKKEEASELEQAYVDFTKGAEQNWFLCGFAPEDAKFTTVIKLGQGSGGLDELKQQFDSKQVQFAVFRVIATDDAHERVKSVRSKYVGVTFVGKDVPAMKRISGLKNKDAVAKAFKGIAVWQQITSGDDLEPAALAKELKGGDQISSFDFGGGVVVGKKE